MQVNPDQLVSQLRRRLAPVYFVHGDEPLLVREAADTIRAAATAAGFSERQVLTVESGFDWNSLSAATQNLSLFAERRLIELHMPTGKPGEAGAQQLVRYAAAPPPDTLLLVIAGKLEKATRESRWAKALDAAGAAVIVWPIETAQLPGWIARRMLARGLKPGAGVTELLAYHMEGNLLACDQEIEKLAMLWGTSAAVPATAPGVALPPASLPSPDAALPLPSRDGVMPREGRMARSGLHPWSRRPPARRARSRSRRSRARSATTRASAYSNWPTQPSRARRALRCACSKACAPKAWSRCWCCGR